MYNPSTSQGSDITNEWIEILNDGCEDVDLSGWTIEDIVSQDPISPLDGGSTVLEAGEYALIIDGIGSDVTTNTAWDIEAGTRIFGTDDRAIGNGLNNSGDTITLSDNSGNLVDRVIYDVTDSSGCGDEANGEGFSLERVDPLGLGDCTNFRSMELLNNFDIGGTPGFENNLWIDDGDDGDRESHLDKIPDVTPLRADGLKLLEGETVCAVVYDSDISINYDPLNGSLKGDNLGVVAFEVRNVVKLDGFSSSSLPEVGITLLDAKNDDGDGVCEGPLGRFLDAPKLTSSSEPFDVDPELVCSGDDSTGDTDDDGVCDDIDKCPEEGTEVTGTVDADGCPNGS